MHTNNLINLGKKSLLVILSFLFLFTFNVSAQNSTTPSSTPTYGIDMTACRFTFDWATYVADQRAGRTASNPYTSQGCVRQNGLNSVSGAKYSDFSVGQVDTKTAFGSDPVLGVFPNGNQPAQSLNTYKDDGTVLDSKESKDRSKVANLNSIFTSSQLSEIYSTGGSRTGMPRIFLLVLTLTEQIPMVKGFIKADGVRLKMVKFQGEPSEMVVILTQVSMVDLLMILSQVVLEQLMVPNWLQLKIVIFKFISFCMSSSTQLLLSAMIFSKLMRQLVWNFSRTVMEVT
ncbi:hypothetical protein HC864_01890 [Candidatus Gracilibacteria bacterium]|nr:hypothetical protein [Candidatus Gracilibacteria bacterium]